MIKYIVILLLLILGGLLFVNKDKFFADASSNLALVSNAVKNSPGTPFCTGTSKTCSCVSIKSGTCGCILSSSSPGAQTCYIWSDDTSTTTKATTTEKTYKLKLIKAPGSLSDKKTYYNPGGWPLSSPLPHEYYAVMSFIENNNNDDPKALMNNLVPKNTNVWIDFSVQTGFNKNYYETNKYEIVWSKECPKNANSCTIKMDSDKTITFLIRKKSTSSCDNDDLEAIKSIEDSISSLEKQNKELSGKIKELKEAKRVKKELLEKYQQVKAKNASLIDEYSKELKELEKLCK